MQSKWVKWIELLFLSQTDTTARSVILLQRRKPLLSVFSFNLAHKQKP
jgi:hypothetical protein